MCINTNGYEGISESDNEYDKLLKTSPMVVWGEYGKEITYYAYVDVYNRPFLVKDEETLNDFVNDAATNDYNSHQKNPNISDGGIELDDFIKVEIKISEEKIEGGYEITLLKINNQHNNFNSSENHILSYRDELPDDDAQYDDEPVNELYLENIFEFVFPIHIGTLKESYYQNRDDFPEESIDEVKAHLTIKNLK